MRETEQEVLFEERQRSPIKDLRPLVFIGGATGLAVIFFASGGGYALRLAFVCTNLIVILIVSGSIWLALRKRLTTQIRLDGLYIIFEPDDADFRVIRWEDVAEVFCRRYDAKKEYGGYGARGDERDRAYILDGRKGVQVVLANDRRILIGSSKAEELASEIRKAMVDIKHTRLPG